MSVLHAALLETRAPGRASASTASCIRARSRCSAPPTARTSSAGASCTSSSATASPARSIRSTPAATRCSGAAPIPRSPRRRRRPTSPSSRCRAPRWCARVREAAAAGVGCCVIISTGFAEAGDEGARPPGRAGGDRARDRHPAGRARTAWGSSSPTIAWRSARRWCSTPTGCRDGAHRAGQPERRADGVDLRPRRPPTASASATASRSATRSISRSATSSTTWSRSRSTEAICVYVEGLLDGGALPPRPRRRPRGRQAGARGEDRAHRGRREVGALAHREPGRRLRGVRGGVPRGGRGARPRSRRHGARRAFPRPSPRRRGAAASASSRPRAAARHRVRPRQRARACRWPTLTPGHRAPQLGELLLPPQADNPVDLGGRRKAPEDVEIAGDVARLLFERSRRRLRPRHPHLDAVLRQAHAADRRGGAGRRQAGDDRAHARAPPRTRRARRCARSASSTSTAPRTRCACWRCVAEHDALRAGAAGAADAARTGCPTPARSPLPEGALDRGRGQAAARGVRRRRWRARRSAPDAGGRGRRGDARSGFPVVLKAVSRADRAQERRRRGAAGPGRRRTRCAARRARCDGARAARAALGRRPRGLLRPGDGPRRGRGHRGRPARSALRRRRAWSGSAASRSRSSRTWRWRRRR